MDVSSFGEVQALLSLFNLIGMLLAALQIVIINITATNKKTSAAIIQQFEHLSLLFMAGIFILITAASLKLQQFFNFSSYLPFIVLGAVLIISVPVTFRRAFIHGKSKFTEVSFSGGIGALGKLVFSAALVLVGYKTLGAIVGILISQIIALVYTARVARRSGFASSSKLRFSLPDLNLLKPEFHYLLSVMIVFLIVTLLYMGDVLVAKRYFAPELAGQFAGISAISKIIFFATASFAGVLLASVGQNHSNDHNQKIRRRSLLLVILMGGATLLLFSLIPHIVIDLMIGPRYIDLAHLLPLLSLAVFLASIVNLYFCYYLALRRYAVVPIAIIGGALTLSLTIVRHDTLESVIYNFLGGSLTILLLIVALGALHRFNAKTFNV